MAHHKSAKKRHRQSLEQRARNRSVKKSLATAIKKARTDIVDGKVKSVDDVKSAVQALANAARLGVVNRKAASRRTGRLMKAAHAAGAKK